MILSLLIVIILLMIVPAFVGILVLFHTLVRSKKVPADTSNRIGHLRLVWFATTRENLFAELIRKPGLHDDEYAFPWLRKDEQEIVGK